MKKETCELFGVGELLPDPTWRLPPHFHSHHELILIRSGTMLLKTKHGDLHATGGDVLFYNAGLVHEEISMKHDPMSSLFIAFRTSGSLPAFPLRMRDSEGRIADLLS